VGDTGIPYPAYVMVGTLLWQGFVEALNSPIKLITSSKSMLAKINFPREALILAGLGEVLFNFTIRLILLVIVFVWFQIQLPITAIWAPFGVLALIALGLMIGILLAPLGILYQDVEKGLAVIIAMWLLVTPVAYVLPNSGPASLLISLNPVGSLIITTRELLTTGTVSQLGNFLLITGIVFLLLFVGWVLYRLAMPYLIERMSA
jgi:lipopolysaccharide transport system permease protein